MTESLKAARERVMHDIRKQCAGVFAGTRPMSDQLRELQKQAVEAVLRAEGYTRRQEGWCWSASRLDALLDGPAPEESETYVRECYRVRADGTRERVSDQEYERAEAEFLAKGPAPEEGE